VLWRHGISKAEQGFVRIRERYVARLHQIDGSHLFVSRRLLMLHRPFLALDNKGGIPFFSRQDEIGTYLPAFNANWLLDPG